MKGADMMGTQSTIQTSIDDATADARIGSS
jgi:hypothetical protein